MKHTFPRELRLVSEPQFKHVFKNTQQKITAGIFNIYSCCNGCAYPRVGIIVPKRNVGKATARNHLKRLVREYFRLKQWGLKKIDLVFFVNKKMQVAKKKDIKGEEIRLCLEAQMGKLAL
jgi:ribonuclease P protein component